jgi:hypothetical protein
MDYGTDFRLVNNDIIFTADGDIEMVSGAATVAQDIAQQLRLAPGALIWDKKAGSSMLFFLNDVAADVGAVIAELERVSIEDPRVDPATVKAARLVGGKKFRLEFTPLSAVKPEVLDYDLEGVVE